jgi:hypothetical protein
MGLEMVGGLKTLSDQPMVVDFAIDRKRNGIVLVGNWLSTAIDSNNAQSLMSKNCSIVSRIRIRIMIPGHILVRLATKLPDQSGPRWRHCFTIFKAVGLNAFASGTWWQPTIPHMLVVW